MTPVSEAPTPCGNIQRRKMPKSIPSNWRNYQLVITHGVLKWRKSSIFPMVFLWFSNDFHIKNPHSPLGFFHF